MELEDVSRSLKETLVLLMTQAHRQEVAQSRETVKEQKNGRGWETSWCGK